MEISNSIVSANFARSIQENRQVKPEQDSRADTQSRRSANASVDIDSDEIERRGQAIQSERVQRVNDLESVPLRTRQALSSYQDTVQASQQFEQGELVGVDLFV